MSFKPRSVLLFVLLFALASRLYLISYPSTYYFDEVYHAMTAKLVARNDLRAYEWTHGDTIEPNTYVEWLHPPMAKYSQAAMIVLFGENAVGWRMSSVVFGVGVVLMTALLAQRLFGRPWLSVLAAGLVALDGLLLTQSRIAMNDIHLVFGFLVSLYAYVWYRQSPQYWRLIVVGAAIGLTIATKWSGAFVWASIVLFEFGGVLWSFFQEKIHRRKVPSADLLALAKKLLIRILVLGILPLFIYLSSYLQMFLQGKDLFYFVELHKQIFWYQFSLDATHPYQSRAWEWVFDLRPVWYFVEYLSDGRRADIYNTGNVFVYWGGCAAALATAVFLINKKIQGARSSQLFSLSVVLVTYLLCWIPWSFSPRIMFSYHYAPAIPLLAILIAYWWIKIWHWSKTASTQQAKILRGLLIAYLIVTAGFFILWYPNWVAIPISTELKNTIYFAFGGWR